MLGILVVAVVGFAFQQTAIVPAVETVQKSLHSTREWSAWLVTVYLIVATVATPAMGRLADLHGRRRLLLAGLAVFVLGSAAAAFAPDMPVLLVCRALQGIGGSVYPLCLAITRERLPRERVTAGIAVLAGAFGLGTIGGFLAGGLLAQYASWRWIFGAGAIVVAAGTVLVRLLPGDSGELAGGGFDRTGTAVLSAAVMGLLIALTVVVPLGWSSPITAGLLALAAVATAGWVRVETRRADPLVDVHVLLQPQVAIVNLATIGLGWALFSSYLLVPAFAQHAPGRGGFGLGAGPAVAGLVLLPLAAAQTVCGSLAGRLSGRLGARSVYGSGLVLVAVALALLSMVHTSAIAVAGAVALLGAGAGFALQAASDVATQGVAADVAGVSSAVNSTVRRLAGGVGGQVSTIIVASLTITATREPSRSAFDASYLLAAGLAVAGAALIAAPVHRRKS